ncbi:hypothetical protein LEP1GSC173_2470 [Leptospira interrogans str. HAI1594]|uniref:Uncharacterized protein n=2 Tax=Leptospira interrogans TaxID=173 RepID=Q72SC0_LEPIC|nr:conserved hypothetical protein [Leptospira interrogans serovar Copenhageni str. Fiocruz L1-130]AJR14189.1 hypothetical protein LIL_11587 [Leptospira interrogans serovar Linhai str. 56609]ALE39805.1 hypothetical protein G436_2632 [Leptospira interrogans serovar Hardjo str. Norma]ALO00877.1 hypothetical protein LIH_10965 [Leptospira interrogans serovar Hardjo-prajitno]EKP77857.1 hypothetical protein LEP1GSC173_2470 [Leptospira interrogans str. HAI1594]QIP63801.1 hypothetical protein LICSK_074
MILKKLESVVFKWELTQNLGLFRKIMWELLQITILRTSSKIVGTHTFRNFYSCRTYVKMEFKF